MAGGERYAAHAMTAELAHAELMSVADYLAWEEAREMRHEYVGGVVYAMAGGTEAHAALSANVLVAFAVQLRGRRCRAYGPDLKMRVQYPTHTRFYYPDAMVVCSREPGGVLFTDSPTVIVEVISPSSRRVDLGEKCEAYLTISSLQAYLVFETARAEAVVWRRGDQGFSREVYAGLEAVIDLPEIEARLPLADAYEAVELVVPPAEN